MGTQTVFFVQKSPALAGAQKSLFRLMQALRAPWRPVLITGSEGWLAAEARSAGIPVIVHAFPSSRSLKARLIGNRRFGLAVAKRCRSYIVDGCLVQGNDHIQSLAALEIARSLKASSLLTLRSSEMTRRDFFKYSCHRHRRIVAVGHELRKKISDWSPEQKPELIENGVVDSEICLDPVVAGSFPLKVVVLGSVDIGKGWRDLVDALVLLETQGRVAAVEFALLGNARGLDVREAVGADRLRFFKISHIPLTADFIKTVSSFKFAVHPSREECFGMALLEVLAAGLPLLTSRTGVAEKVVTDERFLFETQNAVELAGKLGSLMQDFSGAEQMVRHAGKIILERYCIARVVADYSRLYLEISS
jgi:glycosyltransferase involved in cell wall biosynthesis